MSINIISTTAKIITSFIYQNEEHCFKAEQALQKSFGPMEDKKQIFSFDFTDYYNKEFGEPLKRKLVAFKGTKSIENIHQAKIISGEVEKSLSIDGKRTVNIDPGYLTEAKMVLLTTKDFMHRIYLKDGIFAEATLHFQKDTYKPWPWTYPDYASCGHIAYFNDIRSILRKDLGK
ncbi:MAG: DUF4416 family protein [Candidatus Omnitrophica bacterium]|nr:DUF4416 family protein [Candidatus Omnitrophota bacterium]